MKGSSIGRVVPRMRNVSRDTNMFGQPRKKAPVESNAVQSSGIEPNNTGLAATGLQQTKFSGIENEAADSTKFGNMTNGLGSNRFGTRMPTMDTSQGLASSGVIGGIKLI